jgi:hypothetical protein
LHLHPGRSIVRPGIGIRPSVNCGFLLPGSSRCACLAAILISTCPDIKSGCI